MGGKPGLDSISILDSIPFLTIMGGKTRLDSNSRPDSILLLILILCMLAPNYPIPYREMLQGGLSAVQESKNQRPIPL